MTMNSTNQTHLFVRYINLQAVLEEFAPIGITAEKVIPPIWYTLGFIGNPISAFIWLGQRMRRNNSSAVYLGFLSLSDMLFLVTHLLYILQVSWGYSVYNNHVMCELFNFVYYTPQYFSTFLVLSFTVERYVAVCHPFKKEKWCTVRRALILVLLLFIFSCLIASAQVYIWAYNIEQDSCNLRPEATAEGSHDSFYNMWTMVTENLIFGCVPIVVLIFNALVICEVCKISRNDVVKRQQSRKSSGATSTVTLLAVSFYFILTQLSSTIVYILQHFFPHGDIFMSDQEIRSDHTWARLFVYLEVRKVIEVICISHYSCYFFIYCATGKYFRKEILFLLTLHGRLPFLATLLSKKRGKERYSMVSTNGGPMSETYTTNVSTAI